MDLPMVNACTVLAHGEEGTDKYLVAYVVPDGKVSIQGPAYILISSGLYWLSQKL